jgi:hypothetical protein
MINDKNNIIPVTNRQPLLSTVRTQDGSTLPFSHDIDVTSDIDVTGDNIDGTEDNIDIAGDDIDETADIDDTSYIDVTSYILARAETRTPAATLVRASVNRTASASASTSTSFAARLGCLRIPVGPPNTTRNMRSPDRRPDRSPDRSPERSRGRISGGPARRSDGVAIAVDVQFNESGTDNDGDD